MMENEGSHVNERQYERRTGDEEKSYWRKKSKKPKITTKTEEDEMKETSQRSFI